MIRTLKLLVYYPMVLVSSILLLVLRVFGWGCLLAFVLFGGLFLAGELDGSGWIVAALLAGGIASLVVVDLFLRSLERLNFVKGS